MIRNLIIFLSVLLIMNPAQAQLISTRLDIFAGVNKGTVIGRKAMVDNQGFIMPSAIGNLNSLTGVQLKAFYKFSPQLSVGIGTDFQAWKDWQHPMHTDYDGISINHLTVSPHLKIHTPQSLMGVFNRLNLYFELAPGLGYSLTSLDNPLFEIIQDYQSIDFPDKTTHFYASLKSTLGASYILNRNFGVFLSYTVDYYRMNSMVYFDRHVSTSGIGAGLFVRMWPEKRQFYTIPF